MRPWRLSSLSNSCYFPSSRCSNLKALFEDQIKQECEYVEQFIWHSSNPSLSGGHSGFKILGHICPLGKRNQCNSTTFGTWGKKAKRQSLFSGWDVICALAHLGVNQALPFDKPLWHKFYNDSFDQMKIQRNQGLHLTHSWVFQSTLSQCSDQQPMSAELAVSAQLSPTKTDLWCPFSTILLTKFCVVHHLLKHVDCPSSSMDPCSASSVYHAIG